MVLFFIHFFRVAPDGWKGLVIDMKKRFLLATLSVIVIGVGCSGCGQSVGNDLATTMETSASDIVAVDESENTENKDISDTSFSDTENSVVHDEETVVADISSHETEIPKTVPDKKGAEEETVVSVEASSAKEEETTEATAENCPSTDVSEEKPKEDVVDDKFVAYDPKYVVSLAIEKTKAYGKILVWENLDRMLTEGKITQEEYDEYYPYDGLENSYYSVFVEADLSKASTISGELLGSEDAIANYIAEMMALETEPYFAISYAGIHKGVNGDFYEFRCHR